jgi:choline dehydrogenase-like flavoprotein
VQEYGAGADRSGIQNVIAVGHAARLLFLMILASADEIDQTRLEATVCIVGAGAAGIALASALDGCNFKVLLLEAGGYRPNGTLTDYYGGSAAAPHPDPTEYRRILFGGTTGIWGGRCVPFDPIDFERRDYVPNSGWPMAYSEVARYYPKALEYCDAGQFDFSVAGSLFAPEPTISGFNGDGIVLDDRIERYSLPTHFGKKYRRQIAHSANVTALLHSRCLSISKHSGDDRVEKIEFVDVGGRRRSVSAAFFVLATGGIETARLLLSSDVRGPGLGNRHDRVGRFYMCHIENTLGTLIPNGATVAFDFEKTIDGVYCRRKLQLSDNAQREHKLLNTAFRLHFPDYSNASHGSAVMSAIFLAKSFLIPEYRAILKHNANSAYASPTSEHRRNVLRGLPSLAKFGFNWLVNRQLARRKLPYTLVPNANGSYPLEFNCEQAPLETNRITLTNDLDMHGLRRIQIDWRIDELEIEAALRALRLLRAVANRSSSCRVEYDEIAIRSRIAQSVPLGGHHIGTARMSANERAGVVDANCTVFGLPNLFVASSATFPTSSHANPTLTIVALALRLADFLKSKAT